MIIANLIALNEIGADALIIQAIAERREDALAKLRAAFLKCAAPRDGEDLGEVWDAVLEGNDEEYVVSTTLAI